MDNGTELHVIFGTGPLGKWTARELVRRGKHVRMVNRSGTADGLPGGVELVRADAYDAHQATALAAGATAVYQCAQPPYHEWVAKFPQLQASILAGAATAGAKLIVAENLYVYGRPEHGPLTETSPLHAHTRKGKVRLAMTETLAAAWREGKVRGAIARGSDFFGPDDTVSQGLIYTPALRGKSVSILGRLDQPHTLTYAPDFGKTLATLGTRDEALGQVWHVPSNPPVTQGQYLDLVRDAVGKPVKVLRANPPLLWLAGLRNPDARELIEMLYEFDQPFVMDSEKTQRTFGLAPTPLPEAVQATVAWARAQLATR
ncbi:MAG TPA: NAD-dependent epimerase/dehydratase family protein [Ktedonobacterales bacterium]